MNEHSQMMNQAKIMKQKQPLPQLMSQLPPPQTQMMNQPMPMMNRSYGIWPHPPPINPSMDPMMFQNPFGAGMPSGPGRSVWKGKKGMDKQKDLIIMRNEPIQHKVNNLGNQHLPNMGGGGYQPPTLQELQSQNRTKARKYYHPKKKFNNRFAPYAPRNTSSFIIRAKKSGGIASLVSPCPVTPAVLPTPVFSPSREVLGDTAKEEWGVDGYGSMKGLIRLRSHGNDPDGDDDDDDEDGSSDSDVEEHVEVERRLDHDLSRFEMIYPNGPAGDYNNLLENRVDDQDTHIAQLEEENLTLKERLFLMEREMGDLRRRLQNLERLARVPGDAAEEVVENGSDNDAESSGRGEDQKLGVRYNEESEYADEHLIGDGHRFQKENIEAVVPAVLKNPYEDGEEMEKKVEGDVNMEESEVVPKQDVAEQEVRDAKLNDVCDEQIMRQANDEETSEKKVMGGENMEEMKFVDAKITEEHKV
uniref:PRLI-interacting factor A n=1 Tax=Kalanchoe fedtschenkoi TaxID=63787 RepID=A0A7N0TLT7_KALFE